MLVLTVAPIIDTFRISFTRPRAEGSGRPTTTRAIFGDEVFRAAVINTVIVALVSLALELGVGLSSR